MRGLRRFTESVGQAVLDGVGRVASRVQERKPLPSDLLESEDAYLVVFDAPGATLEDVQVRYESGGVHVRIDRFRAFHDGYDMLFPGRGLSLGGRADLPTHSVVDPKEATATLGSNGTLRVEIPKADGRDGRRVSVDARDDGGTDVSSGPADRGSTTGSATGFEVDSAEESTDGTAGDAATGPTEDDDATPDADAAPDADATPDADANATPDADGDTPLDAEDHDADVKEPRTDE